jgi:hypothetical protein
MTLTKLSLAGKIANHFSQCREKYDGKRFPARENVKGRQIQNVRRVLQRP